MRENVKLDVAIEILSSKIAKAMDEKNKIELTKLLQYREKLYQGDISIIDEIIR